MIYSQVDGFRNDLSMLDYIKACGGLKGNGMAYYIEGYDSVKFKLSNFKEKFDTIPEFREAVTSIAKSYLYASIRESNNTYVSAAIEETEDIEEELPDAE